MSDYIEVDGLRVGPNVWRNLKEELTAAKAENEALRQHLSEAGIRVKGFIAERDLTKIEVERLRGMVAELRDAACKYMDSAQHPESRVGTRMALEEAVCRSDPRYLLLLTPAEVAEKGVDDEPA